MLFKLKFRNYTVLIWMNKFCKWRISIEKNICLQHNVIHLMTRSCTKVLLQKYQLNPFFLYFVHQLPNKLFKHTQNITWASGRSWVCLNTTSYNAHREVWWILLDYWKNWLCTSRGWEDWEWSRIGNAEFLTTNRKCFQPCVLPLQLMLMCVSSLIFDMSSLWIPDRSPFRANCRNCSSGSSSSIDPYGGKPRRGKTQRQHKKILSISGCYQVQMYSL